MKKITIILVSFFIILISFNSVSCLPVSRVSNESDEVTELKRQLEEKDKEIEELKNDEENTDKEELSQESKIDGYNDRLAEFSSLLGQINDMYDKHFLTVIYPITQLENDEPEEIISNAEKIITEFELWQDDLSTILPPDYALNIVNYLIDFTEASIKYFTYSKENPINYSSITLNQLEEDATATFEKAASEIDRIKLNFNNEAKELGLEIPFPSAELPSEEATEEEVVISAEQGTKENPWPVGTEVNNGEIIWKILSAQDMGNILRSTNMFYEDKTTTGKFIKVKAIIKNIGTETVDTTFLTFKIIDSNFREFTELAESFAYIESENDLELIEEINPGMEREYTFIFEVPLDAEGFMFEATDLELIMEAKTYISLGI